MCVFKKTSKVEIGLSGPDFLFGMMSVMRFTVTDASNQIPGLSMLHHLSRWSVDKTHDLGVKLQAGKEPAPGGDASLQLSILPGSKG